MSIPTRLASYLDQRDADYDVRTHELSRTSAETARSAHIPPHQLAKSVVLEDDDGCLLAVLPADSTVQLAEISDLLDRRALRLAKENRIAELFDGCDRGAVPAVGMAWGVETIVDEDLISNNDEIYMESGDHERLLHMSGQQFQQLMGEQRHGRFCKSNSTVH